MKGENMDRFAYGKDFQFAELKKSLQDGRCHVYSCTLPTGFNKRNCRVGFEKCLSDHSSFKILIDYGIRYSRLRRVSPLLRIWLECGELVFLDFNDMKEFLNSLKSLY